MSLIKEFREFALRGNVIDLAVGVVIGAAFGKIVSSLVADVIMPPIGLAVGGVNFADLAIVLRAAIEDQPEVVIAYGKFLQTIIDFIIIAFAVMMGVKAINKLQNRRKKEEAQAAAEPAAEPVPSDEVKLLSEIRDLLKREN
ncbi:MAG: large-conductance mechanosensitive channel protein MscL [Moraxellaceae bacterium]|nr:large-conductance mechanosensitive channel protein MscL [Moraxellaceae bacterium]MDZ4386683.1 large-conductance mechanosensitive channel protein MscL [Moraxellaceae bacterium]